MLVLDADPGEEPRPSEEPSTEMETEDELAEDLTSSPEQRFACKGSPRSALGGPEDEDDDQGDEGEGGGMHRGGDPLAARAPNAAPA